MGPLAGIRVVDLTTVIMGPYATQILGDLGADVIKVESPEGDATRVIGPGRHRGMAAATLNLQRNKRSIVLDVRKPRGRAAVLRLAAGADVLVHNIRPQTIERLGLAYADVRAVNPRIVYCGAYGYRREGPYGERGAYDDLIQGASGLAALVGRLRGAPAYVPSVIADKITGLCVVWAVLAALVHRLRTGEGQAVEVPMFETMVSFNLVEHMMGRVFEPALGEPGYARMLTEFRKPFRTRDSYLSLLPYTDRQWQDFFAMAGRPELARDPRFTDLASRTQHIGELYAIVEEIAATRTTREWVARCEEVNIPAMPVLELADLWQDEQLRATNFFQLLTHPTEGDYWAVDMPVRFSASAPELARHAPRLGEHGSEILREAGYSDAEIEALRAEGVTRES